MASTWLAFKAHWMLIARSSDVLDIIYELLEVGQRDMLLLSETINPQ